MTRHADSPKLPPGLITRRRFLTVAGGAIVAGCAGTSESGTTERSATTSGPATPPATVPTPTTVTTVDVAPDVVPDGRVLVVVELAGGNDAVNTLVPLTGPSVGVYREQRPSLALAEADLVALGTSGHGLHPSLAPLTAFEGRTATIPGIGFSDPDRSHFVSFDRWWRADRLDESEGWLGRWLDTLPAESLGALGATAIGKGSPVLRRAAGPTTVIAEPDAFVFPGDMGGGLAAFAEDAPSGDPVLDAARTAWGSTVDAVGQFAPVAASAEAHGGIDDGTGSGFGDGLQLAAELVVGDVGARVIVVSVGGFDTHSNQLDTHAALLADLADGITRFWATVDAADRGDQVLLITQSEFGRRVAENGSAGCDHGAAGVSFAMGSSIVPGLHGAVDLTGLLDGDVRPATDPRALFTVALDWLGGDVERVLGRRYDDLELLG